MQRAVAAIFKILQDLGFRVCLNLWNTKTFVMIQMASGDDWVRWNTHHSTEVKVEVFGYCSQKFRRLTSPPLLSSFAFLPRIVQSLLASILKVLSKEESL